MTPNLGLLNLSQRDLNHFYSVLDFAGAAFSEWMRLHPEFPADEREHMFWSFAVAHSDARCRALALHCLRAVNPGAPN